MTFLKHKKRCDLKTLQFGISFRDFFAIFFAEPAAKFAILILRFENASGCDCDFLGR